MKYSYHSTAVLANQFHIFRENPQALRLRQKPQKILDTHGAANLNMGYTLPLGLTISAV